MMKLTIFTPTYNRAYILPRVYESLLQQDKDKFVWLVVDDGSTDNTKDLVEQWKKDGKIEIAYYHQENAGKMAAHNRGVDNCNTELFMCLDSDDTLTPNAVEQILAHWNNNRDEQLCGVVAPRQMINEADGTLLERHKTTFVNASSMSTLGELYAKGFRGETALAFRTEIIRKFPFPIIKGEKFIAEGIVYRELDKRFKLAVLNEPMMICKYQADGYSRNALKLKVKNPKGAVLCDIQRLNEKQPYRILFRTLISYIAISLIAGYELPRIIRNSNHPFLCILLLPIGSLNKIRYMLKIR